MAVKITGQLYETEEILRAVYRGPDEAKYVKTQRFG